MKPNGQLKQALFKLGQIVATPGALEALEPYPEMSVQLIIRHVTGDWSEMSEEDQAENRLSVEQGFRVFSSYTLPDQKTKIWVISEADRSATVLLLPSEY